MNQISFKNAPRYFVSLLLAVAAAAVRSAGSKQFAVVDDKYFLRSEKRLIEQFFGKLLKISLTLLQQQQDERFKHTATAAAATRVVLW